MKINDHTFVLKSGPVRMTLTFTTDRRIVTTHEYANVLIKRVSMIADESEVKDLTKWLSACLGPQS